MARQATKTSAYAIGPAVVFWFADAGAVPNAPATRSTPTSSRSIHGTPRTRLTCTTTLDNNRPPPRCRQHPVVPVVRKDAYPGSLSTTDDREARPTDRGCHDR